MSTEAAIDTLRVRLDAAIKFRNVSPKALARTAGLGETVVRDILQGMTNDIKLGTVEKLARALGLSIADLVPGALDPGPQSDSPRLVSASEGDGAIALRQIDLAYAMGDGREMEDYPDEMPLLFDPGFLRSLTRTSPDQLYVARGDGDSMFPTMVNGDQVIIDTTQRRLNMQDRIWAVSVHGAAMIKRLRQTGPSSVTIISDNTLIPVQEVNSEDLFIAGRVIWIGRKV